MAANKSKLLSVDDDHEFAPTEYNTMRTTGQIELTFEQFKPYFKETQWLTT